ncbi:MAG: type II toxin-antitoxin system Phd/YefM family antitoxin [bacterium]|nr:type II toxin-antitoxin system Phd/YefM family antitoxin [bacterium]
MRIAPVADIKARFSAYLKASEEGPIIVTKNGKPVAVLLAMADEDELERLILAYSPKFQNVLRTAEKQIQDGLGIPHDEFWHEMENEPSQQTLA